MRRGKMRSRFVNVDYFVHSSLVEFPHLLSDEPSPCDLDTDTQQILLRCLDSSLSISLEIEEFEIEDILNRFFAHVLPHNLQDSQIRRAAKESTYQLNHCSLVGFEAPELYDFFSDDPFILEKQDTQIFSQHPPDIHNGSPRDTIPYPRRVSESVYLIREISHYNDEKKSSFVDDDGSYIACTCRPTYPPLEVNEVNLELYTNRFVEERHSLLENVGYQPLNQRDNMMTDGKELLGSINVNFLECVLEHCLSKQCLDLKPTCIILMLDVDVLCLKKTSHLKGDFTVYPETLDATYLAISPVYFQEIQILDIDLFSSSEVFFVGSEPETCDQMLGEDIISSSNFYKSIVNDELATVDDIFKMLPQPVLFVSVNIWFIYAIVEELLAYLNAVSTSASDAIYLDWHLLQDEKCNRDTCSIYWNRLVEIHRYSTDTELKSVNDRMVVTDFVFCFETPDGSSMLKSKGTLCPPRIDVAPCHFFKDDQDHEIGESVSRTEAEIASSLFKSMSQFNDLDFFLNPTKPASGNNRKGAVYETHDTDAKLHVASFSNLLEACGSTEVKLQSWDAEVHVIELSHRILDLIHSLQKIYLGIVESDIDLNKNFSSPVLDNQNLLSLPNIKLMDWIKDSSARNTTFSHEDETIMPVVALYAIKQLAYFLCFYGIHITHHYMQSLCQNLKYLREKLILFQSVIEDAHEEADSDITLSHPSLFKVQRIFRLNSSGADSKVLIVADQVFLYPLKRLLTSMKISFQVLENGSRYPNQQDIWDSHHVTNFTLSALQHSDCLLTSHEPLSASFPFDKFSFILEYGGSHASSRICTISPKSVAFPRIHFLKLALEDFSVAKALSEGVDISRNTEFTMEGIRLSLFSLDKDVKDQKIKESLKFVHTEGRCVYLESLEPAIAETCRNPMSASSMPLGIGSEQMKPTMPFVPDTIILMNTQSCDKDMLVSRRSSYQKVLAMEKRGAQIVEREINLPVDLIFTATMCLVWYNCTNFGKRATTSEASLCIPLWVENIATNVLTSLSFSFSNCILVFEGESRFLAAVMESSDGLYAAAASLGVGLQLFCSYSSETTDEIILRCIYYSTKLIARKYLKMFESEILAESFLTRFPSINPLSAHAILSSGGILVEFLEWSHSQRVLAIGKYSVHDEGIILFSALCGYGEQEESKSGMTECSSISSAQDSVSSISKLDSRKRERCDETPHSSGILMDDCFIIEPLNQSTYCNLKPSRVVQPYQSQVPSKSDVPLEEIEGSNLSLTREVLGQEQYVGTSVVQNLDRRGMKRAKNVYDDFMGEVIDLDSCSLLSESLFTGKTYSVSMRDPEKRTHSINSSSTRKYPFNTTDHPALPTSASTKSYSSVWSSLKNRNEKLKENTFDHTNTDADMDILVPKAHAEFLGESMLQRSNNNAWKLSLRQSITFPYGVTPLSNAIDSSELQEGSPWTTEHLNKIEAKKKMNWKSLLGNSSATPCVFSDEVEKLSKKSPSILESYRYRRGSNSKNIIKKRRHKPVIPPSTSSTNGKASDSITQTWTPVDKRARQILSFTRNGPEKQSKLVWSDDSVPNLRKRRSTET